MKNDSLTALVILECFTCKTISQKYVSLYSEKRGNFICAQCGYKVISITFQFEDFNIGLCIRKQTSWEYDYDKQICVPPGKTATYRLETLKGILVIMITSL